MSYKSKNSLVHILEAESYEQRLERMNEYQDKNHKYPNVQAIRTRPEGRNTAVKEWFLGANIVTDSGDLYYAQRGAAESPTETFDSTGRFVLRTGSASPAKGHTYTNVTTPISGSNKVVDSGYPKTNDTGDADNTGDAVNAVSWRVSYATGDFNATGIIGGAIHNGGASPAGTAKLLTHFSISSFDKTASDTLKLFVNHTLAGV